MGLGHRPVRACSGVCAHMSICVCAQRGLCKHWGLDSLLLLRVLYSVRCHGPKSEPFLSQHTVSVLS